MIKYIRDCLPDIEQDIIDYFGEQYAYQIHKKLSKDVMFFCLEDKNIDQTINASKMPFKQELKNNIENKLMANNVGVMLLNAGAKNGLSLTGGFVLNYVEDGRTKGAIVISEEREGVDQIILHENLHVVSTRVWQNVIYNGFGLIPLEETDEDTFLIKDKAKNPKKEKALDGKYQVLNEVFTDLVASLIMQKRRDEKRKIIDNQYMTSLYSLAFPLFVPIYQKYKNIFDRAYIEGNVKILEQAFGAEQVEELNTLLRDCIELRRTAPDAYVHFLGFIQTFASFDNSISLNALSYIYQKNLETDLLRSANIGRKSDFNKFVEIYALTSKNLRMMDANVLAYGTVKNNYKI